MVKTLACHARDNGFDPRRGRHLHLYAYVRIMYTVKGTTMYEPHFIYTVKVSKGKLVLLNKKFDSYLQAMDYCDFVEDRYGKLYKVEFNTKRKKVA